MNAENRGAALLDYYEKEIQSNEDMETNIIDAITDLLIFATKRKLKTDWIIRHAISHCETETN